MPMEDDVLRALEGEPVSQCFPVKLMFEILETVRSRITTEGSSVGVAIGADMNTIERYAYSGSGFGPELRLMKTVGMVQDMVISLTISNTRSGFPVRVWILGMSDLCHNRRELLSCLSKCLRTPAISMQLMVGLVEGDGVAAVQQSRMNDRFAEGMDRSAVSSGSGYPEQAETRVSGPRQLDW